MSSTSYNSDRKTSIFAETLPHGVLNPEKCGTVIVMVGLPARGKTFMSTKLCRYLNWIGIQTKVFNVGEYRRRAVATVDQDFFRKDNSKAAELREIVAGQAMSDLTEWLLGGGGEIALFDATNTTRERRKWLMDELSNDLGMKVLFVESVCDDPQIIEENILDVKVSNPDYAGVSTDKAVKDFIERIHHYEVVYEPLDEVIDADLPFLRIFNQGKRYVANHIKGNLQCRIVYYLMNMKIGKRTFYITRHGESELNKQQRLGGNANLTQNGKRFAKKLVEFMEKENLPHMTIWTSLMRRTIETASEFSNIKEERWKALNELNLGVCEEMTYEEIQTKYPQDFERRHIDKYRYRYPMGESYEDLVNRLEPVIMELEQSTNILVICHQAVARCLLGYFDDVTKDKLPLLDVPLHTVYRIRPTAYKCIIDSFLIDVPAVSTAQDNVKLPVICEKK